MYLYFIQQIDEGVVIRLTVVQLQREAKLSAIIGLKPMHAVCRITYTV